MGLPEDKDFSSGRFEFDTYAEINSISTLNTIWNYCVCFEMLNVSRLTVHYLEDIVQNFNTVR